MRRDWPAVALCLPFLGPIAFLVLASLTPSREFSQGRYWSFPPTLENFSLAWQSATFVLYYRNTILYTVGLLAVQLVTVTLAGYALARLRFPGRQGIFYVVLLQLFLPPVVLILPNFLTLRAIGSRRHAGGPCDALRGQRLRDLSRPPGLPEHPARVRRGRHAGRRRAGPRSSGTCSCPWSGRTWRPSRW